MRVEALLYIGEHAEKVAETAPGKPVMERPGSTKRVGQIKDARVEGDRVLATLELPDHYANSVYLVSRSQGMETSYECSTGER